MIRFFTGLVALLCASVALAQPYKSDVILGQFVEFHYATGDKTDGHDIERTVAGTAQCYPTQSAVEQTTGVSDSGLAEFDSIIGMNRFVVDTSQSGFVAGTDYDCWIKQSTLNGVTTSYPVGSFSIENRYPLKGSILLHTTEDTSQTSTVSVIELTGNPIIADNQYQFNRLWDPADGWVRAIVSSSAANDSLTIYPNAPAAPTNNTALYIVQDVIYPINFFDPLTQTVVVGGVGATVAGSSAFTNQGGANATDVFNNGGSPSGTNARIGTIATNLTTALADLNRIIGATAIFEASIVSSADPTHAVSSASPGADSYYINKRICIQQGGNGIIDCAWVVSYVHSTKVWTLSNALRFTIANGDVLRIIPIERQGF